MATIRDRNPKLLANVDWFTITLYIMLMAFGWISVCGASYDPDLQRSLLDLDTRSGMQLVWIGTSIVLGTLILNIDERVWSTFGELIYLAFMILLLVTPFLARDIKGSLSWIKIGPFSLQPAEFAKFATALCVAKFISKRGFTMKKHLDALVCWIIILLPMGLIVMQKETGSALVYLSFFLMLYREGMSGSVLVAGISAVTYFVVGVRFADTPLPQLTGESGSVGGVAVMYLTTLFTLGLARSYTKLPSRLMWRILGGMLLLGAASYAVSRWLWPQLNVDYMLTGGVAFVICYLIYLSVRDSAARYFFIALFALGSIGLHQSTNYVMKNVMQEHQRTRIYVLLGMKDDPRGAGYNVIQAKIAIGSGGLKGKGFKNGTQTKLKYVPEQDTDFIFCTVGEEEGFLGCLVVLSLFLALILRLVVLAERQLDVMARVFGYCVLSVFLFHLFINVGMVLGLTPVIGIPLPFFSYGGSSLWGFTILLFIFLRMDAMRSRLQY